MFDVKTSKTQMDELVLSCETIQDSKSETKTKTVTTKTETKTKTLTLNTKTKTKTETVKILSQDCLETRQCLETSHHWIGLACCCYAHAIKVCVMYAVM